MDKFYADKYSSVVEDWGAFINSGSRGCPGVHSALECITLKLAPLTSDIACQRSLRVRQMRRCKKHDLQYGSRVSVEHTLSVQLGNGRPIGDFVIRDCDCRRHASRSAQRE